LKYVTAFLLFALCVIGALALILITRDNPQYAAGEPVAIVKDWSQKQQAMLTSDTSFVNSEYNGTEVAENSAIWTEDYLGHGKWLVSRATLTSGYSKTEMTFEEWLATTKGWNSSRLAEYASDLSPEQQETFQEHLRTYAPGQQFADTLEKWHLYEESGLVEKIQD